MGWPGISDRNQYLCFALALWNGHDPILKERLFGLTGSQGNHGEDVKEYYFYLDSTPTHSYMKMLYKYPQARFPYEDLIAENRARGVTTILNTNCSTRGAFADDRYFDVLVEYAKAERRRHPDRDHRHQSRAGERRMLACCRRSGFAIRGVGAIQHGPMNDVPASRSCAVRSSRWRGHDSGTAIQALGDYYLLLPTGRA